MRAKRVITKIETREEMEALVGEIASLIIEREGTVAELDQKVLDVRAEYESRLIEYKLILEARMAAAQDWSVRNLPAFGDRKSIEMVHATVGYRTGQPRLKTLRGKTWEMILSLLPPKYVRTKKEPDKEAIIADRDALGPTGLHEIGVEVTQDEAFYVEPKREEQS